MTEPFTEPSSRIAALSPQRKALLAQRLRAEAKVALPSSSIPRRRGEGPVRLSFAQERLWFLDRWQPGSPAYNLLDVIQLTGRLEIPRLADALRVVLRRHEALRTIFVESEGVPFQVAGPVPSGLLPVVDLQVLPEPLRQPAALALAAAEGRFRFDLESGPLFRALLLRLGEEEHLLVLTMHHIVADLWSFSVLVRELGALYGGSGQITLLPDPDLQYADFAAWQRDRLSAEVLQEQLTFWRRQLAGAPTLLELPTDHPRPAVPSLQGALLPFLLPPSLLASLRSLGQASGSTLFMVLLAAYEILLHRHSGQEDLLLGSPIAGRTRRELEPLIGLFVNTLVWRADLAGDPSFLDLLGRVRERSLEVFAHQDLPFERLVEELQPERDPSRPPLVQVMFAFQSAPVRRLEVPGLTITPLQLDPGTAKFDLSLFVTDREEGLSAAFEYDTEIFAATRIRRLAGHLREILEAAVAGPGRRLSELSLLSAAERQQVLVEWNDSRTAYPREACLQDLFSEVAAALPEAPSIVVPSSPGEAEIWTYKRLDETSNRLARHLRSLGVRPQTPVCLSLERSPELIVGILAILKAGGIYIPLDASYPDERLDFMLADAGSEIVLVHARTQERLAGRGRCLVAVDGGGWEAGDGSPLRVSVPAESLAYVNYTSGSTGRPKGVAVPHRAVIRLVRDTNYLRLGPGDRIGQVANISFDAATYELWGALLAGAAVVVIPREVVLSPAGFAAALREHRVTSMFLTSALFTKMAREVPGSFQHMSELLVGGDAVDPAAARAVLADRPPHRLLNGYGPTESTTFASWYPIRKVPAESVSIPIGFPLANTTLYVLDRRQALVPPGAPGELCIGGDGLARGYLRRPELTAERFVPHPWGDGDRLYRTGDLVRQRPDGAVEFLGRLDHQVKIRGFRIELGEIEAVLASHPGIRETTVLARREGAPGDTRLVAYVVGVEGGAPRSNELREWLRRRLPEYMLPSAFVVLKGLPLTPNGKVDRKALPAPEQAGPTGGDGYVAPADLVQELLAGAWAEVLGVGRVGVHDDFFALGGHSLLATQVVSRIHGVLGVEIPLRALFENPTVAALSQVVAAELRDRRGASAPPVVPVAREGRLPLSFSQERLWFLDQLEPGSTAYAIPGALRVRGMLDPGALERSLREIVRRHEVLRTTFRSQAGVPFQHVSPQGGLPLPVIDLSALPKIFREPVTFRLAGEEAQRPFDLAAGPLLRLTLLRWAQDDHVALVNMHHIASDGWSLGILFRDLLALYAAFVSGRPSPLPPLSVQYADYAAWQRQWLTGDVLAAQLAFWKNRLAGAPQVLDLPADRPRPPLQTYRGAAESFVIPSPLLGALQALGRESHATLFMILLAAFTALLQRSTGEERLLAGSPIAGRTHREIEDLIGFFVNTLVLRMDVAGQLPFSTLVAQAREMALDAFAHQDVPFEKLVESLQPERDPSRPPLVQVLFALQNTPQDDLDLPGLAISVLDLPVSAAKFDLSLSFLERGGALTGAIEYNADLYDRVRIQRLAGHLRELLEGAAAAPAQRVSDLPLLSSAERQQLLEWNDTAVSDPRELCLHQLFEAQAERSPVAVAVICEGARLTYRELDLASNRLAHRLAAGGAGRGTVVGVLLERSLEMVVSLLAVLKAGGAYLPLDPSYPKDRLAFFVEDAAPGTVLTTSALAGLLLPGTPAVLLDEEQEALLELSGERPQDVSGPDDLAYVIYTSGSTGRPKGAGNAHRGIVNRLLWAQETRGLTAGDRVLQKTPFSFDVSVWELFWPLAAGARLVMARPGGHRDPSYLVDVIARERVTTVHFVPSMLRAFLDADGLERCASVRRVIASGEELPSEIVARFFERLGWAELHNLYGPTETAIEVTAWRCRRDERRAGVPIGRPVANLRMHLLDLGGQPVPSGVPGELHIGGVGVGRGYLRRPALTAERFIPDAFSPEPGGRLYRTGDLARYRADGAIEFLGRIDHQVKVRGLRVELGEIEAALAALPEIGAAAVVLREYGPGDRRLVACLVPRDGTELSPEPLRDALRATLPEPLIPASFVTLPALPLSPSGKVDRRALAQLPLDSSGVRERSYTPPGSPVEEALAEIWTELLKIERVDVHDTFFDLGGHSLLANQLIVRVRERFGIDVTLRSFFEAPTIARFAQVVLARQVELQDAAELELLLAVLEALPEERTEKEFVG